jgi:4-hydroxyphenylacetate 3-monooxygenase
VAIRSGAAYTAALRDGRDVRQGGRRIDDVTAHPGFAGPIRTLAGLYDRQFAPEFADVMTVERGGERISYSYLPPTTTDEMLAKRRNIECWAEQTFGLMGRFPEYCAEMVVGLLNFADVLDRTDRTWGDRARAYYRYCVAGDLCLTHALNDQYYDRTKRVSEQPDPDLILHVVRETSDGPIVRGLRTLSTLAPLSDEALVYPNRPRDPDEGDFALAFAIPMNAPGLTVVCRDLYAEHADPERHPLAARFDEVDAALIFDDVLIPWERVFIYRNPALAAAFHRTIGRWPAYATMVRLLVRLEMFLGTAQLLTRYANRDRSPAGQELLASMIGDIEVLRACLVAAEANAYRTESGMLSPHIAHGYRLHAIASSDRAQRTLQDLLTSSLIVTGGIADLDGPGIGPLVERWFRAGAPTTQEHLRLLAVAADLVMSAFGSRNQLYERLQSGEPDNIRRRLTSDFKETRPVERVQRFVATMGNGVLEGTLADG